MEVASLSPLLLYSFLISLSLLLKIFLLPSYISTDFDVHRNWMSITNSLPVSKWYYEATSEWTLDYPPFFAYFEYLLSLFAPLFDEKMLIISKDPYRSHNTIIYQKLTVMITDFVYIYAVFFYLHSSKLPSFTKLSLFTICVFNPGLLVVDHIHFQYNGILIGILLLSITFMRQGYFLLGATFYSIAVNFKHLFLYVAPVYFIYLLRIYVFHTKHRDSPSLSNFSLSRFVTLGAIVASIFGLSLGPFLMMGQIPQLLSRLFPFGRGLVHAYWAPNFWAIYNTADKILKIVFKTLGWRIPNLQTASMTGGLVGEFSHEVLPSVKPFVTTLMILIAITPMLIYIWKRPSSLVFSASVVQCTLTFYLFGWHVHEKAILLVTIPLSLMASESIQYAKLSFFLSIVGHFSIFPLLFEPTETLSKILLLLFHVWLSYYLLSSMFQFTEDKKGTHIFKFNRLETLYLCSFIPLCIYTEIVVPLFIRSVNFFPLMLTSFYCSLGVCYVYIMLYVKLLSA